MIHDRKLMLLLGGLLLLVLFESGQQYYYITTFDLSGSAPTSYWDLLMSHSFRWVIWLVLSAPFWYWLSQKAPTDINWKTIGIHSIVVLVMLSFNFLSISLLQIFRFDSALTLADLSELYTFFGYQKGPIYLLAYLLTYFYIYYERRTQAYELLVQDHNDLKHLLELDKVDSSTTEISVLTAKIGDSKHLIPIEKIMFIAADDYCVNIHTDAGRKFVLRASLKQLEQDLPESFIRVHRSYMVNFKFISELRLGDTRPHLLVNTGQSIPVARSRCAELNGLVSRGMKTAV